MDTIFVLIFLTGAVTYLFYIKELGTKNISVAMQRGVTLSKYVIAVFTAVFGSAAVALLLTLPLFLYSRLTHHEAAMEAWSALLDRPYFPLQLVSAVGLGWMTFRWLKEGWISYVWALPLAQAVAALIFYTHRYGQPNWNDIWVTFFNWQCGCSASLPQWRVMFPLYTSIAFALGAFARTRAEAHVYVAEKLMD